MIIVGLAMVEQEDEEGVGFGINVGSRVCDRTINIAIDVLVA